MVKLLICFLMNGMVVCLFVCFHGFGSPAAAAVVAVGDSQNVFLPAAGDLDSRNFLVASHGRFLLWQMCHQSQI
jgi:hypothetical protein